MVKMELMQYQRIIISTAFLLVSLTSRAEVFTYFESNEEINNPDRGFYYPYTTSASNFTALV